MPLDEIADLSEQGGLHGDAGVIVHCDDEDTLLKGVAHHHEYVLSLPEYDIFGLPCCWVFNATAAMQRQRHGWASRRDMLARPASCSRAPRPPVRRQPAGAHATRPFSEPLNHVAALARQAMPPMVTRPPERAAATLGCRSRCRESAAAVIASWCFARPRRWAPICGGQVPRRSSHARTRRAG